MRNAARLASTRFNLDFRTRRDLSVMKTRVPGNVSFSFFTIVSVLSAIGGRKKIPCPRVCSFVFYSKSRVLRNGCDSPTAYPYSRKTHLPFRSVDFWSYAQGNAVKNKGSTTASQRQSADSFLPHKSRRVLSTYVQQKLCICIVEKLGRILTYFTVVHP